MKLTPEQKKDAEKIKEAYLNYNRLFEEFEKKYPLKNGYAWNINICGDVMKLYIGSSNEEEN